jgi:hypothetical protein
MVQKPKPKELHHHIDPKLRFRLRIYFAIAAVLVCIVIYNIIKGDIDFFSAVGAYVVGAVIGIFTSRMFHISWDKNAKKVVSRLDIFGGVVLAAYILFEIEREHFVSLFIHGPTVAAVSFTVLAGVMIGRVLGTRGRIRTILKDQRVFSR